MGSFYTLCSITNQTIVDRQELVVQFMLPRRTAQEGSGYMVSSFIKQAKKEGLEKALQTWERTTENWGNNMDHKGMEVSNEGAMSDYVPFGPAIRGKYNDCGDVVPMDDEETQKRVKLMEGILCGIPFASLMDVATDDRWFTYGMKGTDGESDNRWKLKGVDNNLPEFILDICKALTVTYIHAPVYDTLTDPDFSAEGRKDSYEAKWQKEYTDGMRKGIAKFIKIGEGNRKSKTFPEKLREAMYSSRIHLLESMKREHAVVLVTSCLREGTDFEWLIETARLTSAMGGMCFKLQRSQYGSQHFNWEGWKRIITSLEPSVAKMKEYYGYDEDGDEDDI
jgi:hypothetical protein